MMEPSQDAAVDETTEGQDEQAKTLAGGDESREAFIKDWTEKVKKAKKKWENDFKRMKENMAFVASLQRKSQSKIESERYIANFTLRLLSQKVAMLYARNPTATATRRKRKDFALWDETQESLVGSMMQVEQAMQMGMPPSPEALAIIQDYEEGTKLRKTIKKVGETLEIVYQYQCDTQDPEYKTQLKSAVWRVGVCGVAYVKVLYCDYESPDLTVSQTRTDVLDRAKKLGGIAEKEKDGKLDSHDKAREESRLLVESIMTDVVQDRVAERKERLIFDFPSATSIIPDTACRSLKDFDGGHWVAQEYILPLAFVNEYFNKDLKISEGVISYKDGEQQAANDKIAPGKDSHKVCLWEVVDRDTKTKFTICEGSKEYVLDPEALDETRRFWPWLPITFNHVETEEGCEASVFPPSDVDLIKSSQKSYNKSRQALDEHRDANRPNYVVAKGALTEEDKDKLRLMRANEVIEVQGLLPGQKASDLVQRMEKVPIDPAVYDTKVYTEDALVTTGAQEANLGPAQPNVTATVGNIAEQSRMNVAGSNVDDLDDWLSAKAEASGEIILRRFKIETIQAIAGRGAVWPQFDKEQFMDELYLQIVAASSGRPNKAVDISNWQQLGPLFLQSGANPKAVIRETLRRLDDKADPEDFYPMPGMPGMGVEPMGGPPQGGVPGPKPSPAPVGP